MINTKVLLKAMSFMFLPTISILFVIFIGFFDISDFIDFMSSKKGEAVFIRVLLVLGEIGFTSYMYLHFLKDFKKEQRIKTLNNIVSDAFVFDKLRIIKEGNYTCNESSYFKDPYCSNRYYRSYATDNDDIVILEKYNRN